MTTLRIEQLFLRFSARYQRAWTSLFPSAQAFDVALQEWATILDGIDEAGIERALRRCLTAFPTYPPKPAEFLALTRITPAELGLPSLDVAFRAAVAQRWRDHPLVWHAVTAIGQYEFQRLPSDQARRRFDEVYETIVAYVAEQRRNDPDFTLRFPHGRIRRLGRDRAATVTAAGDARAHLAAIRHQLRTTNTAATVSTATDEDEPT